MKKLFVLIGMLAALSGAASAQDYMMTAFGETPQRNMINPAYMPRASFYTVPFVGGLSVGIENSFSYNSVIGKDGFINSSKLMKRVRRDNPLALRFNYDLVSFGVRFSEKHMITASNRLRVSAGINYPHDLFSFVFDNPLESMRRFDLPLNSRMLAWDETAIGYTLQVDKNWSLGVKTKFLLGAAAINTGASRFSLDKRLDHYIAQGDVDIRMGNYNADAGEFGTDSFLKNPGVAFDIGGMYNSHQGWRVGISVTDLGFIKWNAANSSRIVSRDPSKQYRFEGLGDLNSVLGSAKIGDLLDSVYRDMMDVMDIDTLTGVAFKTTLPITLNISGEYDIKGNNMHVVSMNFIGMFMQRKRFNYGITAGYKYTIPNGKFSAIGTLTHKNTDPLSMGLGIMANSRGFQFFMMADASLSSMASFGNARSASFRMGMNFYMGKYRFKRNNSDLW